MYFREKATKNGKLLQLVRGQRGLDGKVRQKVVLSLGGCSIPDCYWKEIAHHVENILSGQEELLELRPEVAKWSDFIIGRMKTEGKFDVAKNSVTRTVQEGTVANGVIVDKVCHCDTRQVGVLLPLAKAWDALGITEFLAAKGVTSKRIHAAQACVFNRLVEPVSEHELPAWLETTAMSELTNEKFALYGKEIFYRAGDELLEHCDDLGVHLRDKESNIFNLKNTVLLYDLTNSYFEGQCAGNPKAKRSANSKEKRTDCPQLSLGLVLNSEGFPIVHRIFAGNTNDSKTLLDVVSSLQAAAGDTGRPTVVMDGGIATKDNLELLLANNYDYVVNGKRTTRQNFAEDFKQKELFEPVHGRDDKKPVFVKRLWSDTETVLLCRSDDRKAKEDAMVSKTEEHFIEAMKKLEVRIAKGDGKLHLNEPQGSGCVNRCIGKIASRYTRASKFYTVTYDQEKKKLSWFRNEEEYQKDSDLHGCYHLRTSRKDMSDDEIWLTYIMLTRVETAFHLLKGELGLRPFYHRNEDRCDAHAWITVLAYHLLRWVEYSLLQAGVKCTWQEVRRLLQTHCYTTIKMPCQNGTEYQVRKPGIPDEKQKVIYKALGIEIGTLPVQKLCVESVTKVN